MKHLAALMLLVLAVFAIGYEMGKQSLHCSTTHYEDGSSICVHEVSDR